MPLYRKIQENGLLVGVWKTEETVEQLLALLGNISMYEKDLEHLPLICGNMNGWLYGYY